MRTSKDVVNEVPEISISYEDIDSLKLQPPFNSIFPIMENTKAAIVKNMQENGYDASSPIVVWDEMNIVVDGHTRYQAAKKAGVENVPVCRKSFNDEDDALEYAIHNQRDRRNLTDADLLQCCEVLDQRKNAGRPQKLAQPCANKNAQGTEPSTSKRAGKSSEDLAELVGVSPRKVEQARTVLAHADDKTKQEIKSGQKSINKAYGEAQGNRKKTGKGNISKPVFNRQAKNKIEYAPYTWNVVVGCKGGCDYCFAKPIAENRFNCSFDELQVYYERLAAPRITPLPESKEQGARNVLVGTMGDLFGDWVSDDVIGKVIDAAREAPDWTFLFLTKYPARMVEIEWPDNAWVGTTVDTQARVEAAEDAFCCLRAKVKFLSCEPLLGKLKFSRLEVFNWVAIGGQSAVPGIPGKQPEWQWVESLVNQARAAQCNVYFKPNLTVRPREFPVPMTLTKF